MPRRLRRARVPDGDAPTRPDGRARRASTSRRRARPSRPTAAGRRRSASTTSSATSSAWPSRGSTATTSTGSRAGRPRPAAACSSGRRRDGTTADLTPAPFNVRTRVHEYGGGSYAVAGGTIVFSNFADGRLYRLDPGDDDAGRRSRPRAVALRRPALRSRRGAGSSPSARTTAARASRGTPSSTSPLDGERDAARPRRRARTSSPRRASRRTARPLAWLEWDHPDMPWDATPAARRAGRRRTARSARPTSPPAARTSRSPSPSGRPTACSTSSATGAAGGTCTGSSTARGSSRSPRWRPSSPTRPGSSTARRYGVPARRLDRGGRPVARAATGCSTSQPGGCVGEVETPFTEIDGLRVGAARGRRARRRRRPSRPCVVRARPGDAGARPASCAGRARSPSTRRSISIAGGDRRSRRPAGAIAHALYYPPRNPAFVGPGRRAAAARRAARTAARPRTPSTALDLGIQLLTSRGIAVVDVDYGGSTGYGRDVPPARSTAQWGVVDVDDCVAAARYLVDRGDVDPDRLAIEGGSAGGYTTLAALAFRDVFAAGISLFGVGDLETLARRHAQVRVALPRTGSSGRTRRRPSCYRERSPDPLPRPDLVPGAGPPGPRRQGRAARPGRGDRRGPRGQRHPARLPRVRGRGPRVPRRGAPSAATLEARALVPRRRSSGSRRPTRSSRSTLPGLDGVARPAPRAATGSRPAASAPAPRSEPTDGTRSGPIELVLSCWSSRSRWPTSRGGSASPYPILLVLVGGARPRARSPGRCPPSSSRRTSSSCCSCRRSCSAAALLHADPRLQGQRCGRSCLLAIGLVLFTTVAVGLVVQRARPGASAGAAGVRARGDRRAAGRGGRDGRLPAARRARAGSSRSSRARA